MLTKLFWVLLVSSMVLSFIYRQQLQVLYINRFANQENKNKVNNNTEENNIIIKDYEINNLTLASNTTIILKDREYIYNFIKRLEISSIQKEKLDSKVLSVYYDNYGDVYLYLERGEIRLNVSNDLDIVWNDYLSALGDNKLSSKLKNERDNLDYLDLRFPNKLFYKFKSISSSTNIKNNQNDQRILGTSTISSSTAQ